MPSYFINLPNRNAGVALPSTEIKLTWPPAEGYTISFWLNLTHSVGQAQPSPYGVFKRNKSTSAKAISEGQVGHITNIDLREKRADEGALLVLSLHNASKHCHTEVFPIHIPFYRAYVARYSSLDARLFQVLIRDGVLMLRVAGKALAIFDDFKFREKRWYHVVITHCPMRGTKVRPGKTGVCLAFLVPC